MQLASALGLACGFGFRVPGSGFRVSGSGFRVPGSEFRVPVPGFEFQVPGSGFWVSELGYYLPRELADLRETEPAEDHRQVVAPRRSLFSGVGFRVQDMVQEHRRLITRFRVSGLGCRVSGVVGCRA